MLVIGGSARVYIPNWSHGDGHLWWSEHDQFERFGNRGSAELPICTLDNGRHFGH